MSEQFQGPMLDPVQPKYVTEWNLIYCCEQCTHFDDTTQTCTLGFPTKPHLRQSQLAELERSGRMALCRLQEID